jgi:hypothetical protein
MSTKHRVSPSGPQIFSISSYHSGKVFDDKEHVSSRHHEVNCNGRITRIGKTDRNIYLKDSPVIETCVYKQVNISLLGTSFEIRKQS